MSIGLYEIRGGALSAQIPGSEPVNQLRSLWRQIQVLVSNDFRTADRDQSIETKQPAEIFMKTLD